MLKMIFKKYYKILITIIFIMSLGIALITGLSSSYKTLNYTFDEYINNYNYQGATITLNDKYTSILLDLLDDKEISSDLDYIDNFGVRIKANTIMNYNNDTYFTEIYSYDSDSINKLYYLSSSDNLNNSIYVEYNFATNNNINLGDTISIRIGDEYYDFIVSSLVTSPEAFGRTNDFDLTLEERNIIYIPTESLLYVLNKDLDSTTYSNKLKNTYYRLKDLYNLFSSIDNFDVYYNVLLFYDIDKEEYVFNNIESDIDSLLEDNGFNDVIDKDLIYKYSVVKYSNSPVKSRFDANIDTIENILTYLPVIFFFITIMTVVLFMVLLINYSKKEIGIMMSLGCKTSIIYLNYIIVFIICFIFSSVLGLGLGILLNKFVSKALFIDFFPVPFVGYLFDTSKYLMSLGITFIVGFISTLISLLTIKNISPIEVMNRYVYKDVKVPKLVSKLTSNFRPAVKFNIITLLRNKLSLILSIICIVFCICMIYSSLSMYSSKNYLLYDLFGNKIKYDAMITFDDDIDEDLLEKISNISNKVETIKILNTNVNDYNITVVGLDSNSTLLNIYDKHDNKLNVKNKGIIMESHILKDLGLSNSVNINNYDIDITDVCYESTNQYNYMNIDYFDRLFVSDYQVLLIDIDKSNYNELKNIVYEYKDYLTFTLTDNVYITSLHQLDAFNVPIYLIIVFSMLIALLIIINTMSLSLIDEKRKISIMLSLGFSFKDISINFIVNTLCYFIFSIIPGLILGYFVALISLKELSLGNRYYEFVSGSTELIITVIIVIVFLILSHILSLRKIKKWNITENIKDRD